MLSLLSETFLTPLFKQSNSYVDSKTKKKKEKRNENNHTLPLALCILSALFFSVYILLPDTVYSMSFVVFIVRVFPLEWKLSEGRDFCLFRLLLNPEGLNRA